MNLTDNSVEWLRKRQPQLRDGCSTKCRNKNAAMLETKWKYSKHLALQWAEQHRQRCVAKRKPGTPVPHQVNLEQKKPETLKQQLEQSIAKSRSSVLGTK